MTGDVIRDRSDYFDGQLHVVCPCGNAYVQVTCAGWHLGKGGAIVPSMTFRCDAGHSFPVSFVAHEGSSWVEVGHVIDVPRRPAEDAPPPSAPSAATPVVVAGPVVVDIGAAPAPKRTAREVASDLVDFFVRNGNFSNRPQGVAH